MGGSHSPSGRVRKTSPVPGLGPSAVQPHRVAIPITLRIFSYNGKAVHFVKYNSQKLLILLSCSSHSFPDNWRIKTRRVWECFHRNRGNQPTSDSHQYISVCRIRRNSATEGQSVCPSWCALPLGPVTRHHEPPPVYVTKDVFLLEKAGVSSVPCFGLCPVCIFKCICRW